MRAIDIFWLAVGVAWATDGVVLLFRHRGLMRVIRDRHPRSWDHLCENATARYPYWTWPTLKLLLRGEPEFNDPVFLADAQRFRSHFRVWILCWAVLIPVFLWSAR